MLAEGAVKISRIFAALSPTSSSAAFRTDLQS